MKKLVLSAILLIISVILTVAQVPQAFKYQAIARDNSGNILSNRAIALRVSILSGTADGTSVYSETHSAMTNNFGLVNLDIGLGTNPSGTIPGINWSSGTFYLKIEMDENGGTNFKPMGVSQLLSVPYALYSGTATGLVPGGEDSGGPGVPANVWSLFGNSSTNPPTDKLGTTDVADLVVVTNNIERLKIKSDGNIELARNLQVGEDLTVKKNVFLNTLSGSTTNNGPFTVANLSPTLLSGTLTVDHATDLNSALNVDGITDLNSAFHVNNASSSLLTGTLLLNGNGTFNQHLLLDNASLNSTSPGTGALVVNGGTGIGKNLSVGGNATFGGNVSINGPLALSDLTPSTSTTTGALTVAGGVGIGKQVNIGMTLNVGGITTLSNKLNANGQVTITANPGSGSQSTFTDYPLLVKGSKQGIAIKVTGTRAGANNYISFWDEDGGGKMWGRIEGQTAGDLASDPEYIYDQVIFGIEFIISLSNTIMAGIDIAGASSSSTVCAGLGACVTAPVPSLIIAAVAKGIIQLADLVLKVAEPIAYNAFKFSSIGVTYASSSGDYAEWLLKANPSDNFSPGDIVGVSGGRISRSTEGAEKVMVISLKPIVLGNMPEAGKENLYEKVAFMGQVPVRIFGKVKSGDCIIPSGFANGLGLAISPDKLKPEDYSRIVGIAWSDAYNDQMNVVNVAVGFNTNDAAKLVAKQETKITQLENQVSGLQTQVNRTNQLLAKLVPGFAEEGGQPVPGATQQTHVKPATAGQPTIGNPSDRTIVYFEVTKEQIQQGYELAETMMREKGVDLNTHPFFKKIKTEPGYKETFLNELQQSVNKAIKAKSQIDSKSGSPVEVR